MVEGTLNSHATSQPKAVESENSAIPSPWVITGRGARALMQAEKSSLIGKAKVCPGRLHLGQLLA